MLALCFFTAVVDILDVLARKEGLSLERGKQKYDTNRKCMAC